MNWKMPKIIICYFIGVEPLRENLILVYYKLDIKNRLST